MNAVLQLKVTLDHVKPAIWRRIVVDQRTTIAQLHAILQVVMGWQDCHLHAFTIMNQRFGLPDPDDLPPVVDERKHAIGTLAFKGSKLTYEYDFGDEWKHTIVVEAVRDAIEGETLPSCVDGQRACPPEDCGGPPGYADLQAALRNPRTKDERQRDLLEWIGGEFDVDRFDRDAINADLAAMFRPRRPRARGKRLH